MRRRAVASSRWSAETGARRLFGIPSGWRRAGGNRQVRLGGNEGGRDRVAPWKPVALEGGRGRVVLSRWKGSERGR